MTWRAQFVGLVDADVAPRGGSRRKHASDLLRKPAGTVTASVPPVALGIGSGIRPVIVEGMCSGSRGDHGVEAAVGMEPNQCVTTTWSAQPTPGFTGSPIACSMGVDVGQFTPRPWSKASALARPAVEPRNCRRRAHSRRRSPVVQARPASRSWSTVSTARRRPLRSCCAPAGAGDGLLVITTVCAATDSQLNTSGATTAPAVPSQMRRSGTTAGRARGSVRPRRRAPPGQRTFPSGPNTSDGIHRLASTIGVPLAGHGTRQRAKNPSYSDGMRAISAGRTAWPVRRRTPWRCARIRRCRVRRSSFSIGPFGSGSDQLRFHLVLTARLGRLQADARCPSAAVGARIAMIRRRPGLVMRRQLGVDAGAPPAAGQG